MTTEGLIIKIHEEAQACIDQAKLSYALGQGDTVVHLLIDQAYRLERIVCDYYKSDVGFYAKLHKNVANLALQTRRYDDAIILAERGLVSTTDENLQTSLNQVIELAKSLR